MPFDRTGECNRCGQCCGAAGSPNQANPWPSGWPESIQTWQYPEFEGIWPHAQLVGLQANVANGNVEKVQNNDNFTLKGNKIYWIWISGHALCKDLEPYGDPSTYSLECPMLLPDPGDGTRPCALVGTRHEHMFTLACDLGTNSAGIPPLVLDNQVKVDQWESDHPLCSFVYVEQ